MPLLGGGVYFGENDYPEFCVDKSIQRFLENNQLKHSIRPYASLGYILTTGANWAKPIKQFKLTVTRDDDEMVSFCWVGKGKVTKVGKGKFQVIEKDFVPSKDLDIVFISKARYDFGP